MIDIFTIGFIILSFLAPFIVALIILGLDKFKNFNEVTITLSHLSLSVIFSLGIIFLTHSIDKSYFGLFVYLISLISIIGIIFSIILVGIYNFRKVLKTYFATKNQIMYGLFSKLTLWMKGVIFILGLVFTALVSFRFIFIGSINLIFIAIVILILVLISIIGPRLLQKRLEKSFNHEK